MVVKREISSSPAPSNPDSFSLSASVLSHSPPAKRAKSKKAPTPKKTASPQSITRSKADGVITSEMKAEMTEAAMDNAYKGGVPFDVLSAKVGCSIPVSQIAPMICTDTR